MRGLVSSSRELSYPVHNHTSLTSLIEERESARIRDLRGSHMEAVLTGITMSSIHRTASAIAC